MAGGTKGTGWFAAPNAIFDMGLSPYEIVVYLNICRRVGPDGDAFPSIGRIASDCGLSKTSVRVALRGLALAGFVKIEPRTGEDGGSTSNLYTLLPMSNPPKPMPAPDPPGGFATRTRGVRHTNQGGSPHEPLLRNTQLTKPNLTLSERELDSDSDSEIRDTGDYWEKFKEVYPRPLGGLDTEPARRVFGLRLMEADCPIGPILDGAERYAAFVARNRIEPRFVMKAARFLDRRERAWEREWDGTLQAEPIGWVEANKKEAKHGNT